MMLLEYREKYNVFSTHQGSNLTVLGRNLVKQRLIKLGSDCCFYSRTLHFPKEHTEFLSMEKTKLILKMDTSLF